VAESGNAHDWKSLFLSRKKKPREKEGAGYRVPSRAREFKEPFSFLQERKALQRKRKNFFKKRFAKRKKRLENLSPGAHICIMHKVMRWKN